MGFCFGWDAGAARLSTVGILGSTCVGIVEARSTGCILIGPVIVLFLGMLDNSFLPNLFKAKSYCCPAADRIARSDADMPTNSFKLGKLGQ